LAPPPAVCYAPISMHRPLLGSAFAVAIAACLAAVACGNGANDPAGCQVLENERCVRAQACGIDLSFPLHNGSSPQDNVNACQLYYQDACLHGFATSVNVTSKEVTACVAAIKTGDCNAVLNPQNVPACSFLNPPDAGVDAGVDSGAQPDVIVIVVTPDATTSTGDASTCDPTCESQCVGDPNCITLCGC